MVHALQEKANCPLFVEPRDYKQDKIAKCRSSAASSLTFRHRHDVGSPYLLGHHAVVLSFYGITKKMVRFLMERGSDGW